jgi:hypothetical protein
MQGKTRCLEVEEVEYNFRSIFFDENIFDENIIGLIL